MNFWLTPRLVGSILLIVGGLLVLIGKVYFDKDKIMIGIGVALIIFSLAWGIFLLAQLFYHPIPFSAQ
jgi:hypothetical protein